MFVDGLKGIKQATFRTRLFAEEIAYAILQMQILPFGVLSRSNIGA